MRYLLPRFLPILLMVFLTGCPNRATDYSSNLVDLALVDLDEKWPVPQSVLARDTIVRSSFFHFQFVESGLSEEQIKGVVEQCETNFSKLVSIIGTDKIPTPLEYKVFPDIEKKGLALQNGTIAQVSHKQQKIFSVIGGYFEGHLFHPENELLIRWQLGKPRYIALEKGLAIYFNPTWQKKGFDHWAGRLFLSGNMPDLSDVLNDELFEDESNIVMGVAAASFVDFLMEKYSSETVLEKFSTFSFSPVELDNIQNEWIQFLKTKYGDELTMSRRHLVPYLKGFNFAHEGYRVYNGYGSRLADESMSKMVAIGSNSLAIVPYSYMRSDQQPTFLPIMRRAGTETDESVFATHIQAKQKGIFTMLKPQIWMRGSWPGNIKMTNESDWEVFFDYYYRWMRHYALLAEVWEIDMLCVGVEFAEATQARPEEWRKLIRKLRGIYSGPMTYAANWGAEFENIDFWDELDYIGLNCYYPLSKSQNPGRDELEKGFEQTLIKVEKVCRQYQKPLIFTEIGFRSVENTWIQPHEEANGRAVSEEAQQLCYDIVFNHLMDKKWCRGIIWWKWPSYPNYDHRGGTGFTPSGKLAEKVIEEWFSK